MGRQLKKIYRSKQLTALRAMGLGSQNAQIRFVRRLLQKTQTSQQELLSAEALAARKEADATPEAKIQATEGS